MGDYESLAKAIGGSLGAMLVLAYPLMKLLRIWNSDRAVNSKDGAEAILYSHLSDQVKNLADSLEKSRDENSKLVTEVSSLRTRVMHLEGIEAINIKFKAKLDQKDLEITELTNKITILTTENIALKDENARINSRHLPFGVSSN